MNKILSSWTCTITNSIPPPTTCHPSLIYAPVEPQGHGNSMAITKLNLFLKCICIGRCDVRTYVREFPPTSHPTTPPHYSLQYSGQRDRRLINYAVTRFTGKNEKKRQWSRAPSVILLRSRIIFHSEQLLGILQVPVANKHPLRHNHHIIPLSSQELEGSSYQPYVFSII